jgi:hypothetical protein
MKLKLNIFNSGEKKYNFRNHELLPGEFKKFIIEINSLEFKNLRLNKFIKINLFDYEIENKISKLIERATKMRISIFNKAHFPIKISSYTFEPYTEVFINTNTVSEEFKQIRSHKALRVGKVNNADYKKRHKLIVGNDINFCFDVVSTSSGQAYTHAIRALADPVLNYLKENNFSSFGYTNKPTPGKNGKAVNCRYFNSYRIGQQGKCPVGPNDVFISHGIGDKNYWTGPKINEFNYAFCPGPIWEERMLKTGYKGKIYQTGYTKLDPLFNGQYTKNEFGKPCVVWAPTHGYNNKNKGRSSFPQCLNLIKQIPDIYQVKMALHPTSKMHSNQQHLPTMQDLLDADVVIADAGSTLYEAWILGKPVIFPDWLCRKDVMNHFSKDKDNLEYQIYSKSIGYHAEDMKDLLRLIPIAIKNGMKDEEKTFIENICPKKTLGRAGELSAKAILEIQKNIK